MNEDAARKLLLVRAVEGADISESLLTREDRRHATEAALAQGPAPQAGGSAARRQGEAFLARRAAFAYERLASRYPAVAQACRRAHWPAWLDWALPLAALLLGIATNEIDSGKRLSIIAFPLLGMLAWNLAVYVLLLVRALAGVGRRRPRRAGGILRPLVAWLARPGERGAAQPSLGDALRGFTSDWLSHSAPLTYSRTSRVLHVSAAALAAGVILGMYLRALGIEYRAGWESTFVGAGTLHAVLQTMLGPASALTDIPVPDVRHVEALRWSDSSRGENAGPWIHLFATTALLFIVAPRLAMAAWHVARAARLRRRFPVPGSEDFYVRRLLRAARGGGSMVRVLPYSFHPGERGQRHLQRALGELLGEKTQVRIDPPVAYGEEDDWLAATAGESEAADHLLLLFNLASTPEAENHGALVSGVARRALAGGAAPAILLDASAYRQRLAGQSGADARLLARYQAWQAMLAGSGLAPLMLDLESEEPAALARLLEPALVQAPPRAGERH